MVLPYALDVVKCSLFRIENGRYPIKEVFLRYFIVLVRRVDLLIKDVLEIGFEKWLAKVDLVWHAEFIKLVEFDEGHSQTIETALKPVLLPVSELHFEIKLDEMEEVEVGELVVLYDEEVSQFFLEFWVLAELLCHVQSELFEPDHIPPVRSQNYRMIGLKCIVFGHDDFGKSDCGFPNLVLVVLEIYLFPVLAYKVDAEPESEFTGQNN